GGMTQPHQRHLYQHDLLHSRAALLAGMLDQAVARRERINEYNVTYDLEDDIRSLSIEFDENVYGRRYRSDEDIFVPWLYPGDQHQRISSGTAFQVLIRAREEA